MIKFRVFLILLIIIAIIATFYTPPAILSIRIYGYRNTASPFNIEWNGTSRLVLELSKYQGLEIVIANTDDELLNGLKNKSLLLIVAPDQSFNDEICEQVLHYYRKGLVNIAVFDETTILNNLLIRFGVRIVGKAILETVVKAIPYYPLATIIDLNNNTYVFRLNYGSPVEVSSDLRNARIVSTSYGLLDVNDNGKQDDTVIGEFPVGVLINNSSNYVLVFGDSYPLTNNGLMNNLTVSRVLIEYIVFLARSMNSRVIIPSYLYKQAVIGGERVLYHPSIALLIIAVSLKNIDMFITSVLSKYPLTILLFIITIISIFIFNRILKYLFHIGETHSYDLPRIKRYYFIVGSTITRDLWSKDVIKGSEKELLLKYWTLLLTAYRIVRNIDLENTIDANNIDLLIRIGFTRDSVKKILWMRRIVNKIVNKKFLPIVMNWRSVLKDFIINIEEILNIIGYTIMNKGGFRDVSSIIK